MPISEAEARDLDAMKAAQAKVRDTAFSMFRMALRYTPQQMKDSGYEKYSKAEMIQLMVERYIDELESLVKKHVKKYPDSK